MPILIARGLPIRKFRIQSQRGVWSPRSLRFMTSLEDTIVLNADLVRMLSVNSIEQLRCSSPKGEMAV